MRPKLKKASTASRQVWGFGLHVRGWGCTITCGAVEQGWRPGHPQHRPPKPRGRLRPFSMRGWLPIPEVVFFGSRPEHERASTPPTLWWGGELNVYVHEKKYNATMMPRSVWSSGSTYSARLTTAVWSRSSPTAPPPFERVTHAPECVPGRRGSAPPPPVPCHAWASRRSISWLCGVSVLCFHRCYSCRAAALLPERRGGGGGGGGRLVSPHKRRLTS